MRSGKGNWRRCRDVDEFVEEKGSGEVGPEPGPNMMWNAKYGMHRGGMMGGSRVAGEMLLSPDEARDLAQRWLDARMPGREAGIPDAFYGYYTLHFTEGGAGGGDGEHPRPHG